MSKYGEYDQKLLQLIGGGARTFGDLCQRLAEDNRQLSESDPWRVTDRRLQALRRKGRIVYHCGEWSLIGSPA